MTIRVAVVGLGWAGREIWLRRLARHAGYHVAAVVDARPEALTGTLDQHPGVAGYPDIDRLTADEIDLAVVAVPNHLHAEVGCRLLAAGIPVFLEKPVCLTSEEADALARAERVGGAVLLAGSAARYRADVRALREEMGSLGAVRHIELAWIRASGVPAAGGWFTRREQSGGGALVDLGWHLLDTLGFLLGPTEFDQAVAAVSQDFLGATQWAAAWRQDAPAEGGGGDVEDTVRGFLVSRDGVSATVRASWASHEPLDATSIRIEGSAGTADLRCTFGFSPHRREGSTLTVVRAGRTQPVRLPAEEIGAEYGHQLDGLPGLLADPASRGRATADAHRTIALIERLYDSARRTRQARSRVPA